jgi:hypothetical protein
MLRTKLLGAAMVAALAISAPAYAGVGTGGGPVEQPGDDPGDQPGGGGDDLPGGGGTPSTPTPPPSSGYTGAVGANVFDLENYTPAAPGGYNTFSFGQSASQTVGGLTMSLTPASGITLGLADESVFSYLGLPVADVGHQSAFDFGFGASTGQIYANFSAAISDFSLMAYKLAGPETREITINAYSGLNGTGTLLGTVSGTFGGPNYSAQTFSLTGLSGAQSFGFNAATRGNTWFDNFSATVAIGGAVPEPANWALIIGGFGLIGAASRRRRIAFA